MDRYADGDDQAFDELYTAMFPRLYRYSVGLVRDRSRAEDLVQQTLEKMLRGRGRFVRGSRVTPWAFSILLNQVRDQARRPKIELLTSNGELDTGASTSHPDPMACTAARQLEARVRAELDRLSPSQKQAFELVYYGEMSQAEAAEVLDVTVASIKSRLQRAHEVLRAALQPADEH